MCTGWIDMKLERDVMCRKPLGEYETVLDRDVRVVCGMEYERGKRIVIHPVLETVPFYFIFALAQVLERLAVQAHVS